MANVDEETIKRIESVKELNGETLSDAAPDYIFFCNDCGEVIEWEDGELRVVSPGVLAHVDCGDE